MSRAASPLPRRPGGALQRHLPMLQGVVLGALAILATPTAALAVVLLLPTAMAMASDRLPGRPVGRAVLLFGLAGACFPMSLLWRSGHGFDGALALATDLRSLAICWSAQAGGWLVAQLLPIAIGLYLEAEARTEMALLDRRRAATSAEWPD
jgi:hypothetical protein